MTKLISITLFVNKDEKEIVDEFAHRIERDQVFLRTIPANRINVFKKTGFRKQGIIYLIKKYNEFKRSRQSQQPQEEQSEELINNNQQQNEGVENESQTQTEDNEEDSSGQ